jgi:tetratricopeptide (TPR) repeat protein
LGNQYLKDDRLPKQMAIRRFKRAIELLEAALDMDPITDEHQETRFACYLNIAKAYIDCGTPELARANLDSALSLKPNHVKATYRYGCYFAARQLYQEAQLQFRTVLDLQPQNSAAQRMLDKCERAWRQQQVQERKLCQRMFRARI